MFPLFARGGKVVKRVSDRQKQLIPQIHVGISSVPEADSTANVKQTHPFLTHACAKPCLPGATLFAFQTLSFSDSTLTLVSTPQDFPLCLLFALGDSHVQQILPFSGGKHKYLF